MNGLRLSLICLALSLARPAWATDSPLAPGVLVPGRAAASPSPPPLPQASSPVAVFRRLLSLSAPERESYLTNRPPEIRAALRAKISEYLAMDPDARELRLRATELRWQLIPLLRTPPAERGPRLALVPEDLAPLVKSRLAEWDQLPPALQQEFLANDRTLHYFAHVDASNRLPPPNPADSAAEQQRQNAANQFNQFFELTPDEKQRTLKTLSAAEQAQMDATLQAYGKLTPRQRAECLRAFTKFAGLSQAERREFLKNAGAWSQMSPKERQTWRDLVARVPSWPPLPPTLAPPPLPSAAVPPKARPAMATNQN